MNSSTVIFLFSYLAYVSAGVFTENTSNNNKNNTRDCQTPDQKLGQCIPIRSCSSLWNLMKKRPLNAEDMAYIRKSLCVFGDSQPKICCAGASDLEEPTSTTDEVTDNLLPDRNTCGQSPLYRIIGGNQTFPDEFPWVALLEYETPTGRGFHCGGSLISNRYILTAAHCVKKLPKQWKLVSVRLGEYNLETEPDCLNFDGFEDCQDTSLDIPIEEEVVHEQYDPDSRNQLNDIALLRLSKEVSFTEFVKPICLPKSSYFPVDTVLGSNLGVSGWGITKNHSRSDVKLKFWVSVKPHSDCTSLYSNIANVSLSEDQLCVAGNTREANCASDAGGPLMKLHVSSSPYYANNYVVGVASFGPSHCELEKLPKVFTRVTSYVQWIVDNLKP